MTKSLKDHKVCIVLLALRRKVGSLLALSISVPEKLANFLATFFISTTSIVIFLSH